MPSSGTPRATASRIAVVHAPVERARRAEVADARHDDAASPAPSSAGAAGVKSSAPTRRKRLPHRRQIAGAVVDERDHSSPFVLGSICASRRSFAHATRSARANALNTASMW